MVWVRGTQRLRNQIIHLSRDDQRPDLSLGKIINVQNKLQGAVNMSVDLHDTLAGHTHTSHGQIRIGSPGTAQQLVPRG